MGPGADAGGRPRSLAPSGGQPMGHNYPRGLPEAWDLRVVVLGDGDQGRELTQGRVSPSHLFSGNLNVSLTRGMLCRQDKDIERDVIFLPIFLFIIVDFLFRKGPKGKER